MVEATFRPRGPFSLRLSAAWASDATMSVESRAIDFFMTSSVLFGSSHRV